MMFSHSQKTAKGCQKPPSSSLGLHQVYPDPKTGEDQTVDIVVVHGLGGDSFSSFMRDECFWIRDLLPMVPNYESARIMTFGYDATAFIHPFAKANNGRTFIFAETLLSDLADKRTSAATKNRPLVLMGHSLGGIVIKTAMNHAHMRRFHYGPILDSTKAIVFFGTPHQGSAAANWVTLLGNVGKAAGLRNAAVVEELKRWSDPLVELTRNFSELVPRFSITTFFEKQATNGVVIVPEASACIGHMNERTRGLDADHHGICKFTEEDPNWNAVRGRLEAVAVEIAEAVDVRLQERLNNLACSS